MSRRTSTPQMQTALRRSLRLKGLRNPGTELQDQQIPQEHETRNQQFDSNHSPSKLQVLSSELRLCIFSYLIITERPFLIGRCQEERRKIYGSPRDIHTSHSTSKFKVRRNEHRNRPTQPAITRVCRTFRKEVLPLWYNKNHFWLIHNEFKPENENELPNPHRGFDAWISQTPRDMFNFMQHVSLCGYGCWPNRMMISIDLKNRQVVHIRHYSTYGHELPIYPEDFIESIKQIIASKTHVDGLAALKAVLADQDSLFQISEKRFIMSPPGMMSIEPASGWEYDW